MHTLSLKLLCNLLIFYFLHSERRCCQYTWLPNVQLPWKEKKEGMVNNNNLLEGGGSVKLVLCHLEEQTPVGKSEGHAAHLKESVSTNNDWNWRLKVTLGFGIILLTTPGPMVFRIQGFSNEILWNLLLKTVYSVNNYWNSSFKHFLLR